MTQIATVEKILPTGLAEVSVPRKSACGHDCEECAGCVVSGAAVRAFARNPIGARPGDKVVIESSTKKLFSMMLVVYMLPLLLFLLGYFCSAGISGEGARYVIAISAFCLGIVPAVCYDRSVKKSGSMTYTITRLF